MNCKWVLAFLLLFPLHLLAQERDSAVVTFHVTGGQTQYEIFPKDSILWGGQENILRLVAKGKKKEAFLILSGGTMRLYKGSDSLYTVIVDDTVTQALLSVREKTPDGKTRVAFTKPYRIKRVPPPVVYVCGVKSDSVIDRDQLIVQDFIYAQWVSPPFRLVITSFDMTFTKDGTDFVLHSSNNHFTVEQRREIHKLRTGNMIYFDNIRCLMPKGEVIVLKPAQIYVDETNKYKVGDRKTGK